MDSFKPSNCRNFENAFNLMPVIKSDATHTRSYYNYLDEVQTLCNTLMDYIVYNDRRVFALLISAYFGIEIERVTSSSFANPEYFPLTQVVSFMVFNRDMQNYSFECIYDSMSNRDDPLNPELIPNAFEIIAQN